MKHTNYFTWVLFLSLLACKDKPASNEKVQPTENLTKTSARIIDLSHKYSDETVYWVTAEEFKLDTVFKGHTDQGFFYCANNFSTAEHGGTHIDAPIHFAEKGQSVDEIPLEKLIGPAIKIDVSSNALKDRDYLISIDDLKAWETEEAMEIPSGSIVLLQTGYAQFYPNPEKYMGTAERGAKAVQKLHFPGLSKEAAQWLVDKRDIHSIGIDTPSIDFGQSTLFESHVILLSENIPAFENLNNLDQLPSKGFEVIALPMKIEKGSGAPLRIIALVE